MEQNALEKWGQGDPSGFLDISSKDVVYFDPALEWRLDGHQALTKYYEAARGKILTDKYELLNPKVQAANDMAVLTFNFISSSGQKTSRWNCTEVYQLESDGKWRIIQTHWSYTQPTLK